jgi:tetratricopeptide (TPR) repeat protein
LIRDVLVKLAEQLVVGGPRARAEAALDQAEAMNAEAGDRALAARIITARAHLDLFDVCELPADRVQAIIDLFQEMDDPFAEARGWWALVRAYHGHGEMDLAAQAAERALDCARKVGSQALISRALYGLASATARGYVPVAEAIPRLRALRPISPHARCEARLLIHLAELETWRGRPDVARALVDEAHALAPSSGGNDYTLQTLGVQARIALVAGNPQAAEALARENCAELERLELTSYLRSELGDLVDALTGQGRLDEASEELERAAAIEMPDEDVDAIYRQARARARIQLARGDVPGAEASARVAVENVAKTGMPDQYANVLTLLALVLVAANREPEARAAAEQALELADRKGHVVYAQTARELLGAMSPVSVA